VRAVWTVVALALGAASAEGGTLEGRWRLVEQRYGSGAANLIDLQADAPLHLEFLRQAGGLRGRLWHERADEAVDWPAAVPAFELRSVHLDELVVDPAETAVRTSYRVDPAPGDDLVLEVQESYRVVEGGRALVGDVTVAFRVDGRPRGSYVLHRRFERQR
jgi:hypothetical protein